MESTKEKGKGEGEGRRVGGGILLNKALFGEASPLRPKIQCLTLKYTIFDKRYPFRVSSIKKLYPFHISAS